MNKRYRAQLQPVLLSTTQDIETGDAYKVRLAD
jgi:hypothetical protein